MPAHLFPMISFVLIMTFTPGPSNVSSASVGVLHGYKKSLRFQAGLAAGVFLVMVLSGSISTLLLGFFPALESVLRYIGAGYILYLAFAILKASYTFNEGDVRPMGFSHGLTLQVLNPKMFVYAFTLFSAFLAPVTGNWALLLAAVTLLTMTSFCATSAWTLFGTVIKTYLHHPRVKVVVNVVLALFLVYTAVDLAGVI